MESEADMNLNLLSYHGCGIECRNGQVPIREFLRCLEDLPDRVKSNGSNREYKLLAVKLARCSFVSPKKWNNLLAKYLCVVQDDGEACLALGRQIGRNSKSSPDHKLRGKLLLIKSFNLGNALAALELGRWYARYGHNISATKWFEKSFEKGCKVAGLELGRWFESLANYEMAERYFRLVGKQPLIEYWFRRLDLAEAAELSEKLKLEIEGEIDKEAMELCEEFKSRGVHGEVEVYEHVGNVFRDIVSKFPREGNECRAKQVAMAKGVAWYKKVSTKDVVSALGLTGRLYLLAWSLENAERCFLQMGDRDVSHDWIKLARSFWLIGNNDSASKCIFRSLSTLKLSEWHRGKSIVDVSIETFDGYGNYYLQDELRYVGLEALLSARKTEDFLAQLKAALRNAKTAYDSVLCDMPF